MKLNGYQRKLLAAAATGKPYGDPYALDNLQRRGLLKIDGLEITITEAGRSAMTSDMQAGTSRVEEQSGGREPSAASVAGSNPVQPAPTNPNHQ